MRDIRTALPASKLNELAALEGLVSSEVGEALAALAYDVLSRHAIVEVGSYRGKSTAYLAAGSAVGGGAPVFAVDPWDTPGNMTGRFGFADPVTLEAFRLQVDAVGLSFMVTPLRGFSVDVARHWQRPIGLLYIDGSHLEKDVRADFAAWAPYLAPNAVVAFDDYRTPRNPGVAHVVDALKGDPRFGEWHDGPAPLTCGRWLGGRHA